MKKSSSFNSILWGGLLFLFSMVAGAQTTPWPNKVIKIVVPFAAGSFTDTAARVVGVELSSRLGQTVIVDNKGGAGSTLGTDLVAKSPADGYTLLLTDNSFAVSAALYDKLPYSPLRDLVPVSLVAESPSIMVGRPNLIQRSLKDIVQFSAQNPNKLSYGTGGIGSSAHLAMESFLSLNSLKLTHIPFKGIAGAITDVAADRVDIAIGSIGSAQAYIKDNRLLPIAVSGNQRHVLFPQVPTFAESGFTGYKMMYWFGLLAPNGVPKEIIDKIQREIMHSLGSTKVQDVFSTAGVKAISNNTQEFSTLIKDEISTWHEVIKKSNIKASDN
ncbi:MAG: tripartite tricarboxylate transporter substrate binding protein [Betaproteobacteria bacterium]